MEQILIYALIFFSRIIDVSLTTLRTMFIVQGRKGLAAFTGFFEAIVYMVILGNVVTNMDDPIKLLVYGLGFSAGNLVGIIIENKLALGDLAIRVILQDADNEDLIEEIRSKGFGVTVIEGQGKHMLRDYLIIVIKRKDFKKLKQIIDSYDKKAFILSSSVDPIHGGYFKGVKTG